MADGDTLAAVLARVDVLESRDAVRHLKAGYMQRCDETPRPSFADLLWPDAVFQGYGAAESGPVVGAGAIDGMLSGGRQRFTFSVHYLTNEAITVGGDRARGEWKLLEPCTIDGGTGIWQGGRYVDAFERRDGTWRFTRIELHLEFRARYEEGWHRRRVYPLPALDT